MRYFILLHFSWCSLAAVDYADYAGLLQRYAKESGVDYDGWYANKADLALLDAVMVNLAGVDLGDLSKPEQKAFYINLYNAGMLQVVFQHYPLESVTEIGEQPFDVFKQLFIRQGRGMLSLDDVEKGILLKDYFDPRIHFAVNCASESCPPLRAEPFVADRLEAQLEEQTRLFAASDRAARVDPETKTVRYSELLNWYAADFGVPNPGSYLNRYREQVLPLDYTVAWIPYDWALNAEK
ncbi:MAG: DUF547 domain-containing protein [Verrucomicrobiota bacterium]